MKKIFVIDRTLVILFILTAVSGFGLHIAGHGAEHSIWHNWAVFHVVASVMLLVAVSFHIITHKGWYRSVISSGIGRKSRVTAVLSLIFFIVSLTGLVLLGVSGANTEMGLWHYVSGIVFTVLSAGHIIKRIPLLRKSFGK